MITFRFTCNEKKIWKKIEKFQNIMTRIADHLQYMVCVDCLRRVVNEVNILGRVCVISVHVVLFVVVMKKSSVPAKVTIATASL